MPTAKVTPLYQNNYLKVRELHTYMPSYSGYFEANKVYLSTFFQNTANYIYCELRFENVAYQREDWQLDIQYRCVRLDTPDDVICQFDKQYSISAQRQDMQVSEGWGRVAPGWWTPGQYQWQLYSGQQQLGSLDFTVEAYFRNERLIYKGIETYNDQEFLFNNSKKYRSVFSRDLVDYVFCEVSFYNLYFGEQEWDFKLRLACLEPDINDRFTKPIGTFDIDIKAGIEDNVVSTHEGWGSKKKGAYWKKGAYKYEVFLDDIPVAAIFFYIEDIAAINLRQNPYFNFESIKLYEDARIARPREEREYYLEFDQNNTRYIYAELLLSNIQERHWYGELIFNILLKNGEVKGRIRHLIDCGDHQKLIEASAGWGGENGNVWFAGDYIIQVVFFEYVIVEIPLKVSDQFVKGIPNYDLTISDSQTVYGTELLRFPAELRTPFQQYLLFLRDYIAIVKNRRIKLDVQQVKEGLRLEYRSGDELPYNQEDIQRYFREYLQLPTLPTDQWAIGLENNAHPDMQLLHLKLRNQVRALQESIRLAQREHNIVLTQNEYLESVQRHLLPEGPQAMPAVNMPQVDLVELKRMVAKNRINEVVDIISQKRPDLNECYLLNSRWDNIKRAFALDTVSQESYSRETSRIKMALLTLIDEL